jgi:hypothetical protein
MVDSVNLDANVDADVDADILMMKIFVYNLSRVRSTLFHSCCTEIFETIVNDLHDILRHL